MTASLTPVSVPFADARIGDEIRGFRIDPKSDAEVEYSGRVSDRSTHTLWISPTVHGPRLIVHEADGHRLELVHPAPRLWLQPTAECPSWCAMDEINDEGAAIHVRKIGTMGVEIAQCPNEPVTIAWPADSEVSDYPTAEQATQIGADLVEAARLLSGPTVTVDADR